MVFYGKGGYDFDTIYNMPIWLRKFTWAEIQKHYKEEQKALQNSQSKNKGNKTLVSADGQINTPDFASASKPYKGKTSYK